MKHRCGKIGLLRLYLMIAYLALLPGSAAFAATTGVIPDGVDSPDGFAPGLLALWYGGVRTYDDKPAKNDLQTHELKAEYGVTDSWTPGIWADFTRLPDDTVLFKDVTFDSTYQLWGMEEKWLDTAVRVQYTHNFQPGIADTVAAKLLLEKQSGEFLHRANVGAQQAVGPNATGGPNLSFLWSSRYLLNDHFNPGFEIVSNFGQDGQITGSMDKQQHFAGPAAYGEITDDIRYRAAYLFGVSGASVQSAVRVQLLYLKDF
jgi:hypothetical protein